MRLALPLLLTVTLAACGAPKDEAAAPASADPAAATDTSAPVAGPDASAVASASAAADGRPASFTQCVACHSVEPGKNGVGPTLAGVFGRKAGAEATYSYSAALKDSGLTWDEATLDKWLAAPMATVPGTRMSYAGQPDAAARKELIEYMKTLK